LQRCCSSPCCSLLLARLPLPLKLPPAAAAAAAAPPAAASLPLGPRCP
jgi:hypothetical protein